MSAKLRDAKEGDVDAPAIVFVHGLGGSPKSTWAKMLQCFSADATFEGYAFDCYQFPTKLLRFPFTPPLPGLQEIADGLKTYIDERHHNRRTVSLITHSLGGLVARQYIITLLGAGERLPIDKLALIAVPNTGAALANVGSYVSMQHKQLRELARSSDSLAQLNIGWEHLRVEERLKVRYVLGGCDRVVPQESALPFAGRENKSMLINADHRSIVAPDGTDDIRYQTIRRFILEPNDVEVSHEGGNSAPLDDMIAPAHGIMTIQGPNPVFDIYTPHDEPYYIRRNIDFIISQTLSSSNIWLSGKSGVGKTTVLRRSIYNNGWHLNQVTLAGYGAATPQQMHRALCIELATVAGIEGELPAGASMADQFLHLKKTLRQFPRDQIIANVVEEIPLSADDLARFGDILTNFIASLAGDRDLFQRVRFVISSIEDIRYANIPMKPKSYEHLQVLSADPWAPADVVRLVGLLTRAESDHSGS